MSPANDLFQEWRTADRAAHAAERAIVRAHLDTLEGHGSTPSRAEQDTAHRLRGEANDLFKVAMDQMDARREALRYPRRYG